MCGGQGCAQSQETRQYNSRLRPVLMELGNSNNPSTDYSLAYSYTGGVGDNGDITGATYTDNINPSYSHTFTYSYDGVNRLTHAVATGIRPIMRPTITTSTATGRAIRVLGASTVLKWTLTRAPIT